MKVILLQDVKSLGKKGDMVNVNDGYARNYILPKKLGIEANNANMNNLKLQKQKEDRQAAQELADAKALAEQLKEVVIELQVKTGEGGKVFGSVSAKEIVAAAKADFRANNKGCVRTINVYVKPEDNAAYYVVNNKTEGKVEL